MTGRTNGFTNEFLDAVGAQDVIVSHCIINQENLCTKVLAFAVVTYDVVQCINCIIPRGLNHRHFKAFLEYQDCEYPDVVHYSTVH